MKSTTDNRLLKILLAVAVLLLMVLGTYTYRAYHKNEQITSQLQTEKHEIEKQLDYISNEYLAEIEKGTELTNDLDAARTRIDRLKDSIKLLEPNVALLARLRKELSKLQTERNQLAAKVTMLENRNLVLEQAKDSTLQALNEEVIAHTATTKQMDSLNNNIAKAAMLMPTNFASNGVIIRNSGKQIENDRARRVDDIKVCFTLPQNPLAPDGVQSFYVQVINPDNNVLGIKKKEIFGDQELTYSKKLTFNYNGEELDICELIQPDQDEIIKGPYRINLYNGNLRIGSSELILR